MSEEQRTRVAFRNKGWPVNAEIFLKQWNKPTWQNTSHWLTCLRLVLAEVKLPEPLLRILLQGLYYPRRLGDVNERWQFRKKQVRRGRFANSTFPDVTLAPRESGDPHHQQFVMCKPCGRGI